MRARLLSRTALSGLSLASCAAAAVALGAPGQANAQVQAGRTSTGPTVEEVIVTANTRLGRGGFDAPTPVMVLGEEEIREGARPNIAAALNDMPQFRPASTPQTLAASAQAGIYSIDLRGLGADRTLVLVDGKRFVGDNDLSLLPVSLAKRVDVVTGGSSAAWGSGAIGGVVNIVTDDSLEGARVGAQGSISSRGDTEEYRFDAAAGHRFAGGRGHVIVGAEYVKNDGARPLTSRANVGRWAQIANSRPGEAPFILVPDVGASTVAPGGLILTGVNAGRAFNADGSLRTFDVGTIVGVNAYGGEASSNDDVTNLYSPTTRYAALVRVTYDLTDSLTLSADLKHGRVYDNYPMFPFMQRGGITIQRDNAFLPAAIRNQMIAAGENSFTMGRANFDFAVSQLDFSREITQATVGLAGEISPRLRWDAYLGWGEYDQDLQLGRQVRPARYALAIDAVISPTTGQAVCRSTLSDPTNGCVPINLLGEGAPSQAAQNYVLGAAQELVHRTLSIGGVSLKGETPDLWAGPIAFAVGAEARRETSKTGIGPLDKPGQLALITFNAFPKAENTTKEGFAEVLVPLLKDAPIAKLLQVNGAARLSDDATGSNWSWKLGFTDEVVDGLIIRAARSKDIKVPTFTQLFAAALPGLAQIADPQTGRTYQVTAFTGGNPTLEPETADTLTAGFTLTPMSVPRLSISADYFDIKIDGAIAGLGAQAAVNLCAAGNQQICSTIQRDASGNITVIRANLANLNQFRTSGVDAAVNYSLPLSEVSGLPGTVGVRANFTWTTRFETRDAITRTTTSNLGTQNTFPGGAPRLRANVNVYYEVEDLRLNARARYISSGYWNRNVNIQNNRIPEFVYVDLGVNYNLHRAGLPDLTLSANVNNVFDKDPPIASRLSTFYDVIGRYYSVGVQARF